MPTAEKKARNIGDLRRSGYKILSVREEMRKNLIEKIKKGEKLFPGIIGFEDTVIPQLENALLAGQDIILLGERGQAKSRVIRQLVTLLDNEVPFIAGCEINDNPFKPICRACRDKVDRDGESVEIAWLPRDDRYAEKLATPDISMGDLIGDVDPIKIAEGRYLSDELAIHYGLIPRTNRGIFAINELPDLSERIQVGLFNLMEERDVQIKGYRVRLPLDVFLVASANPEDYTNRGRIITPLKDRYGAHIRTHYPKTLKQEIEIVEEEYTQFPDTSEKMKVPQYMKEIVAEITALARRSADINQSSGVSVRMSIANYESMVSNAFKRSLKYGEVAVPRISDLPAIMASTIGKIELETVEEGREPRIVEDLTKKAVASIFGHYLSPASLSEVLKRFDEGSAIETGADIPSSEYVKRLKDWGPMAEAVHKLAEDQSPAAQASAMELVLEGLHLNRKVNKDRLEGRFKYRV